VQLIAGHYADINTLTTLHQLGMPISFSVIRAAAQSGRLNVLQHLSTEHLTLTEENDVKEELSHYAACSGSIDMLIWLRAQSWCVFDFYTCEGAALGGQSIALQHLRNEGCEWEEESMLWNAARGGSIESMPGMVFDSDHLGAATDKGHRALCQHLHSTGCEWHVDICTDIAAAGELGTLRWSREDGCPWVVHEVFILQRGVVILIS
jgi:hypothetical protein